jgi:hypothetical protein
MIVDTRCATISTAASAVAGLSAARSRASVAASRTEKQSSNRNRPGRFTSALGDRQPLPLTAGDVGAALIDRGCGAVADDTQRLGAGALSRLVLVGDNRRPGHLQSRLELARLLLVPGCGSGRTGAGAGGPAARSGALYGKMKGIPWTVDHDLTIADELAPRSLLLPRDALGA